MNGVHAIKINVSYIIHHKT